MTDIIELVKQLLDNEKVKILDIEFTVNSEDEAKNLARFCGKRMIEFHYYEVQTGKHPEHLIRIRT